MTSVSLKPFNLGGHSKGLYLYVLGLIFLSNCNVVPVSWLLFGYLALLVLVFPSQAGLPFLVVVLAAPDISSYFLTDASNLSTFLTHSIYFDYMVGHVTLITPLIILMLLRSIPAYLNKKEPPIIFLCVIFPLLVPIYGIFTNKLSYFVQDISYFIEIIGPYIYFRAFYDDPPIDSKIFLLIMVAKGIGYCLQFIFFSHFKTLYIDATATIMCSVFLFQFNKSNKFLVMFSYILMMATLVVSPIRARLVLIFYALMFLMRKIGFVIALLIVTAVLFFVAYHYFPSTIIYLYWKLSTINLFSSQNASSNERYVEFINILGEAWRLGFPLLIGMGYGGTFTQVTMPLSKAQLTLAAFTQQQLDANVFFRPHSFINVLLLKSGLFFSVMLWCGLVILVYQAYKIIRRYDLFSSIYVLALYAFPIALFVYNVKLKVFFGFTIYLAVLLIQKFKSNQLGAAHRY